MRVSMVDPCWVICLVHTTPSLCHGEDPAVFTVHCKPALATADMSRVQHLNPSRDDRILTLPESWVWDSETRMRISSWVDRGHTCVSGIVRLWVQLCEDQAVEAALGRGTTVEQVPSEKQNETGTRDKTMRKGASFLLLAPSSLSRGQATLTAHEPRRHTPVCLYPFQAYTRNCMIVCSLKPNRP